MKIGYFCNSTNWSNKPYKNILNEVREIADYCDQNNWDSIWFTEHHFSHEGMEVCPNPLMLSADIAARTNNIRIGQAATIITFWNPVRVAEDIALLDNLSEQARPYLEQIFLRLFLTCLPAKSIGTIQVLS